MLDVRGNLQALEPIAAKSGGRPNLLVVYERCRKNPQFGTRNIFANGRYDELWRVLLAVRGLPCCPVFPRTWQDDCFRDLPPADTKLRALTYVRQHCPDLAWVQDYTKLQRTGIVDAMCIALWAKAGKMVALTDQGVIPSAAGSAGADAR
jgi:hypothetical protein